MMKFGLIGAAGYVAPRHMKAIRETGHELVVTLDPYDGMGQVDAFFPEADFFTEPERFDRHLDKLRRNDDTRIHYVSVCSPNYLHDAHIRMALRNDAHAICEKPLVLNPWNVDTLELLEHETGKSINLILQLRLHPEIQRLKKRVEEGKAKGHDIELSYIAARGKWYQWSWKGSEEKSGGIATNIGIHFFDMLSWIFGAPHDLKLHYRDAETMSGMIHFGEARVRWFLSVNAAYLPEQAVRNDHRSFRELILNGESLDFSSGFADLHTLSYEKILSGEGFRPVDARSSIQLVYELRHLPVSRQAGEEHSYLGKLKR